jgi:hypothetical protein
MRKPCDHKHCVGVHQPCVLPPARVSRAQGVSRGGCPSAFHVPALLAPTARPAQKAGRVRAIQGHQAQCTVSNEKSPLHRPLAGTTQDFPLGLFLSASSCLSACQAACRWRSLLAAPSGPATSGTDLEYLGVQEAESCSCNPTSGCSRVHRLPRRGSRTGSWARLVGSMRTGPPVACHPHLQDGIRHRGQRLRSAIFIGFQTPFR